MEDEDYKSDTLSTFVGTANERVITVTFIDSFAANDYIKLKMLSNYAGTKLEYTAASASPYFPVSPSIIVTVNMISKN